jgi:hypothetical protein
LAAWRDEDCALPWVDDDVLLLLEADVDVMALVETVDIMPDGLLEETLDVVLSVVVVRPMSRVADVDGPAGTTATK